jgi:hypothetical protein
MRTQTWRRKVVIDRGQAASLLYPIAAFFKRAGMTRSQSLAAFAAALDDVRKLAGKRLEQIGAPSSYADLIGTWTRERRFLDSRGRPRPLTLSGAHGFGALAKSACSGRDPKRLLSVLIRYGNVRRLSNGRLQLLTPYFRASDESKVAFEPSARFLNDVVAALTHVLKDSGVRSKPHHFWRTVQSARVSQRGAREFLEFARDRSLIFFEEIDDWLQAHSDARARGDRKRLRVGLGLFSIYSH